MWAEGCSDEAFAAWIVDDVMLNWPYAPNNAEYTTDPFWDFQGFNVAANTSAALDHWRIRIAASHWPGAWTAGHGYFLFDGGLHELAFESNLIIDFPDGYTESIWTPAEGWPGTTRPAVNDYSGQLGFVTPSYIARQILATTYADIYDCVGFAFPWRSPVWEQYI